MENLATNVMEKEKLPNAYRSWIANEEILNYLLVKLKGTAHATDLLTYLPLTPAQIRYNTKIMTGFIGLQSPNNIMFSNARFYDLLPEELQKSPEILLANVQVYVNGRDGIPGWLENKLRQHLPQIKLQEWLSREEAQSMLRVAPTLILGLPEEWQTDLDFLVGSKNLLDRFAPYNINTENLLSRLYKIENRSILKTYLSYHNQQYYSVPELLKKDTDLAYYMLANVHFQHKIEFNPVHWASESFCVKALSREYYKEIPTGFWNKTGFLRKVCFSLDNHELNLKKITAFLPAQTSQLFDLLEKDRYVQSFDKMRLGESLRNNLPLSQPLSSPKHKKKI